MMMTCCAGVAASAHDQGDKPADTGPAENKVQRRDAQRRMGLAGNDTGRQPIEYEKAKA